MFLPTTLLRALAAAAILLPMGGAELFHDDFSKFPPGLLSSPLGQLNGAIQEYHYLANRGVPLAPWENAICHQDAWLISDENGRPYLEQHLDKTANMFTNALFITGDPEWSDYTVEALVKPLSLDDVAGVVFRYHTNHHYYSFTLSLGHTARLALRLPLEQAFEQDQWRELARVEFPYDVQRYYTLRVENSGPRIRAYIDGQLVAQAEDAEILKGRTGVTAAVPARFQDFRVTVSDPAKKQIEARIARREAELAALRAANPQPRLWKKFATPLFGAGRNVRFGDLEGNGQIDMLIGQNIPRVGGDGFDHISCLTAVTLDGKVLWQLGRPDPRNGLLTNDTPFQIHDIDGDGKNEVVMVRDFKLQILDGRTGRVKKWVWMPPIPAGQHRPYELNNGDSIAFLNFSGDQRRHEILVKDRYKNFWIYNNNLELLWKGENGQTGHFPHMLDIDSSGYDTMAIGYTLWDHTGRVLWSHDKELQDHADGIAIVNMSPDPHAGPRVYACGSDEGFILFDIHGNLLKHTRIGHAQSPAIGKFRMDVPGLQLLTVNYWRNPGIISIFDWDGNLVEQGEPIHTGSPLLPVNWTGDGQEYVLLSGNVREGGMLDGQLRRVVMFPDDGHPDLAAYVTNLTGDRRDEVILWDQQRVWIYTQDRPFHGARIYAPQRNPLYNESNYLTSVSLPHWEAVRQ